MKYECHITIKAEDYKRAEPIAKGRGFWMSRISDDAVMGKGDHAYCTKSGNSYVDIHSDCFGLTEELSRAGIETLRRKIEETVLDQRFEWETITGGIRQPKIRNLE